jgi:hypothetical protein
VKLLEVTEEENGLEAKEVQQSSITQDTKVDEISVRKYLNITEKTGSMTLVVLNNGIPILNYWQLGKGSIFCMELNDKLGNDTWNNFHNLPEYPVFWTKLVQCLGGTEEISEYNLKTGTLISLPKTEETRTPSKTFTSNNVLFDEAGIYENSGKKIAINLYSDGKSNITIPASKLIQRTVAQDQPKPVRADAYTTKNNITQNNITHYFIGIKFLLLLLEILIVRQWRKR